MTKPPSPRPLSVVVTLFACVMLCGCGLHLIPHVRSMYGPVKAALTIEPGVTTDRQIRRLFGEPFQKVDSTWPDGPSRYRYQYAFYQVSPGNIIFGNQLLGSYITQADFRLTVEFDEDDVVRDYFAVGDAKHNGGGVDFKIDNCKVSGNAVATWSVALRKAAELAGQRCDRRQRQKSTP
jgi:hypothetical protein